MISNVERIRSLDLSENQIKKVPQNIIPSSVESISLARNPFDCECNTIHNLKTLMTGRKILEDGFLITLNCSKREINARVNRENNPYQNFKYLEYHKAYDHLTIHEANEEFCLNYQSLKGRVSKIDLKSEKIFAGNTLSIVLLCISLSTFGIIMAMTIKYRGLIFIRIKQCWRNCSLSNSSKNDYEEY